MFISILAFSIVANYGIDFIVEIVSESFDKKVDKSENNEDDSTNNIITDTDFSVTGTYSFAVFVTQNTFVPDYIPPFDGYTYDSIMDTYNIQYSQVIRYIVVATIDAANRQVLVDTMSGNVLVTYNDVQIPLDYVYYLLRNGSDEFNYEYLADFAGTYTGLSIDNYSVIDIDRFCDVTNYVEKATINIPEKFTGTHPLTNEQVKINSGEQPLTYELLHMMMNYDGYLTYDGVCRSTSEVFGKYLKSMLTQTNKKNVSSLIKRWSQKSQTDITVENVSEKLDLIFSTADYEAFSICPSATAKKHGNKYYYVININESITNIKKYYNKASS